MVPHVRRLCAQIYLLNEEQRVKIVLLGEPDTVGEFKDHFANFLSNITAVIINVDKIRTHMDFAGKPDLLRTDMFIHGIYPDSGEVIESDVLIE
jgi:cadherin 23